MVTARDAGTPRDAEAAAPTGTRRSGRHRPWLVLLVVTLVGGAALGTFLWLGILPWRGPLSNGPYQPFGVSEGIGIRVGEPVGYTSLWVYNPSRVDVTLDDVAPVGDLLGLRVVDAWFPAPAQRCLRAAIFAGIRPAPDVCRIPAQGFVIPAHTTQGEGLRLIVDLEAHRPGVYRSGGFDLRYHVGPLHFTSTYGNGFVLCTSGQRCPRQ